MTTATFSKQGPRQLNRTIGAMADYFMGLTNRELQEILETTQSPRTRLAVALTLRGWSSMCAGSQRADIIAALKGKYAA